MGRVKQWFSSKLATEAGKSQEADAYAYSVDLYRDFTQASVALPDPCYIDIAKAELGTFVHKTVCYGNHSEVLIDYDKEGNVLGVEILTDSVACYDQRRD
jgi:uncharacterized protein YuzE